MSLLDLLRKSSNKSHSYLIHVNQQTRLFNRLILLAQQSLQEIRVDHKLQAGYFNSKGPIKYFKFGIVNCSKNHHNRVTILVHIEGYDKAVQNLFETIGKYEEIEQKEY